MCNEWPELQIYTVMDTVFRGMWSLGKCSRIKAQAAEVWSVYICVCGRTLECGSPCLFHLLLGECWHLFAMCVMWMQIFVSIVWLAGGRGALLGVVKHNKCGGGGWHRGGTCMCVLGFRWDTFEPDTLALSGVSTDNSLPTTGLACHRHHLSPLIHLALSVCCYLYQSLKIIYF